ncbi:hypothetical protein WIS52_11990 [Pseudonocardia nematodicida]|uniref:DUF2269 domain-containing protein n=1 Tax=Pseudonocardia nematodicida TaxID=1206997 RepID=A0ABV1K9P0_9PSEU
MPSTRTWRRITVWLHVLTSVGWMALAASLSASLALAVTTDDPALRHGVLLTAHHLDGVLLAPLAAGSALTGIVLAAATPFGFFHHWWVAVKFAITLVQLYVGIFVLSSALGDALADPAAAPTGSLVAASALMASAIAFQAWVSIDKPWGRSPWGERRPKPVAGPRWMFVACSVAVVTDIGLAFALGHPMPVAAIVVLVAVLVGRRPRAVGARGRAAPLASSGG